MEMLESEPVSFSIRENASYRTEDGSIAEIDELESDSEDPKKKYWHGTVNGEETDWLPNGEHAYGRTELDLVEEAED